MGSAADFSLKVWSVVVFITAIILGFIYGGGGLIVFAMAFGVFYSLPALLLFILFTWAINKLSIALILKKLILASIWVIMTWVTFRLADLMDGLIEDEQYFYYAILVASIFIFRLDPPVKPREDVVNPATRIQDTESKN